MATFPIPIGVDRMLRDIAEGIGGAAKILPTASRSEVGAVAMRRATVAIEFELSSAARRQDDSMGLGAKTFLFGFGASTEALETQSRNHGRIELEIVAIVEPEPARSEPGRPGIEPKPEPKQPVLTADQIRQALGVIRAELDGLDLDDAERARVLAELGRIQTAISAGDLRAANELLRKLKDQLRQFLEN